MWERLAPSHITLHSLAALIVEKRFVAIYPFRSSGHIHALAFRLFHEPIAMAYRAGDPDIGQAQHFVFLGRVIWLAVTSLAQASHAVDLILVRRTGHMLTITE